MGRGIVGSTCDLGFLEKHPKLAGKCISEIFGISGLCPSLSHRNQPFELPGFIGAGP